MPTFQDRFKELKNQKDVMYKDIAIELDIGVRAVQRYAEGKGYPDYHGLIALADYFDVSLDYLCGRTDDVEKRGEHVYPQFAGRLTQLRTEKGIDIWNFADIFDISARNYAGYEIGETMPDLPVIAAFADYFECSIDYLIGRSDDPAQR